MGTAAAALKKFLFFFFSLTQGGGGGDLSQYLDETLLPESRVADTQ